MERGNEKHMETNPKVLLADSSEEFRLLLRHTLEETGEFQIVGDTGDGDEAWELIQRTRPDVVVADVILPGLDGISLLQRMPKNVKTIILSAFCSQSMVQEVMRLGAWYFIPKPAHVESLLERVRQAVRPAIWPRRCTAGSGGCCSPVRCSISCFLRCGASRRCRCSPVQRETGSAPPCFFWQRRCFCSPMSSRCAERACFSARWRAVYLRSGA